MILYQLSRIYDLYTKIHLAVGKGANTVRLVVLLRLRLRGETHLLVPLPLSKRLSSSSRCLS